MPQVDLETLVSACTVGGSDGKIACETTLAGDDVPPAISVDFSAAEPPPDVPPESFCLSKDAEYDWVDRNAYYERKDSAKGGGGLPSSTNSTNLVNNPSSNSNYSQWFTVSLKSKASIIGLPKTQKNTYVGRTYCNKPANVRLFPKRTREVGKSTAHQVPEPGSPKVSCMGRVRSKRGRRRSNSVKRDGDQLKPVDEKKKTGFCSKVLNIFRSKNGGGKKMSRSKSTKKVAGEIEVKEKAEPRRRSTSVRRREGTVVSGGGAEPVSEPPGLGGMKRFASGRRSCSSLTGED